MPEARKKHHRNPKKKFWKRLILYFFYFSMIFLALYYLFDRQDMMTQLDKHPGSFCWKVFGSAFLFSLALAAWMLKDPRLKRR
jgi:fucose 4-O-acetylase-like acetyltransferase